METTAIPKGYKRTEVGVIPNDWNVKPLEKLGEFRKGRNIPKSKLESEGVPCVLYGEIYTTYNLYALELNSKISTKTAKDATEIKFGDILFAGSGETAEEIGKCFAYIGTEKAYAGGDVIVFTPSESKTSPLFLGFLLNSEKINRQKSYMGQGSSVFHIYSNNLKKILIPLPPTLDEQHAIAAALHDADALISSLERLIAKKRSLKHGAMQELLQPQAGWEVKKLGEVATLKARIGWQGLTTAEYRKTGDYFLITGTEFKNGIIDWENCFYVDEERYKQDKNIQIRKHDVLVTKDGTIGKVALIKSVPKPATLNSGIFVIRPIDNSFHPEFFYYLLLSEVFLKFLSQLSAGSTINHLYQKDFVSFQFLTPETIEDQQRIACILSDMDAEIEALERQLAKYRQIKQGMMQQLLTGSIRLPH